VYEVVMRCPNSLQEAPLGMEIEALDDWCAIRFVKFLYLCGSCGDTHVLNKQYARLQAKGTVLAFRRRRTRPGAPRSTDDGRLRAEVTAPASRPSSAGSGTHRHPG